ncbi:MAG TPA: DNA polymerase III subunit gamma and tau, partial [Microbacteriaceae bacterium]
QQAPAAPAAEPAPAEAPAQTQPVTLQQVKDAWPEILRVVEGAKRTAWMVLATAQPRELRDNSVLVLAFPSQKDVDGLKERSAPGTGIGDYLKQAMFEVLGIKPALLAKVDTRPARDAPPTPPPARLTTEQDAPHDDFPRDEHGDPGEPVGGEPEPDAEPAPAHGWYTAPVPGSAPAEADSVAASGAAPSPKATGRPKKPAAAPAPAAPAENSAASAPPRQRYGESVVREILGASFIEEQTIEARVAPEGL